MTNKKGRSVALHVFDYLNPKLIAGFAVFLALAGTAYASVKVSGHSGTANAGATRAATAPNGVNKPLWAYVLSNGVVQESPGTVVTLVHIGLGDYKLFFPAANLADCARVANLTHIRGSVTVTGYDSTNPDPHAVHVLTTSATGDATDADFVVVVTCGSASGQPIPSQFPATK